LVRYREHQTLLAADLQAQQQQLRAMRRRHNRYLHGYGIVCGLEVERQGSSLIVRSGLALDGRGRELLLTDDQEIPQDELNRAQGSSDIDLWLACFQFKKMLPPAADAGGSIHRVVESARLLYSRADDTVHAANQRRGFVFLARVLADQSISLVNRVQVPLVAEQVTSPDGHVRLSLGPDQETPNRRFGLGLRPSPDKSFVDRLSIDLTGNARVIGNLAVTPRTPTGADDAPPLPVVRVSAGPRQVNPFQGVLFSEPGVPPSVARPWRIYRVSYAAKEPPGTTVGELRFEIAHPGKQGIPENFRWSAGTTDGTKFSPVAIVAADRSLTIPGDLWVPFGVVITAAPEKSTDPAGALGQQALVGNPLGLVAQIEPGATLTGNQLNFALTLTNTAVGPLTLAGVHATVDVSDGQVTKTYYVMMNQGLVLDAGAAQRLTAHQQLSGQPTQPTLGRLYLNVWGVGPGGFLRYQAVQNLTIGP
jgi:hypothetical protein